jgi:hypothetical protein
LVAELVEAVRLEALEALEVVLALLVAHYHSLRLLELAVKVMLAVQIQALLTMARVAVAERME